MSIIDRRIKGYVTRNDIVDDGFHVAKLESSACIVTKLLRVA